MPGIAFGDWGEMQSVSHVLGVAHPTGYPTYIILGWFAQLVPIGSVAVRLNFLSAIFVAGTVAAATAISMRLGVRPLIAMAGALTLGVVGTVWAAATVAEVNPLHLFLTALVFHRALVWADLRRPRDLAVGGLLVGLALGNHLLTLFIAPFVVVYVAWAGRRELLARPWLVGVAALAGLAGAAVYLYIPLAAAGDPPLPYNHPTDLASVVWLVSGTQFRGQFDFLSPKGPGDFIAALPALWKLLADRSTAIVPLLGGIGLAILLLRRPTFALLMAVVLFFGLYIWANYLELEHYLLVPWLILAIGLSVAIEEIARALGSALGPSSSLAAAAGPPSRLTGVTGSIVAVTALALAVVLATLNWDAADRSTDHSGDDYVSAVFDALPPNAAIVSFWDASTPLWHGEFVEGRRPDILIVDDTNIVYEGWVTRERRIATLICDRPVFILRPSDAELEPTRQDYTVTPFLTVRIALGGPSAAAEKTIYRVEPISPSTFRATCP